MSSSHTSSATSRVIDQLQSRIDSLTSELNETKETLRETKQKNSILKRRNDTLVEQLSNAKHESDMSEALLKRKERRVLDLEEQLTEALSKTDSLQFESDNMRKRMSTLQDKENVAVSECERLKVSYDAIAMAHQEYKKLMGKKIADLEGRIKEFLSNRQQTLDNNIDLLKRQEPEIMASYKVVVKNTQRLEEMYAQRQKSVREALVTLAMATKMHGEKTSVVMAECEDVLRQMNRNEEMMLRLKQSAEGADDEIKLEDLEDETADVEAPASQDGDIEEIEMEKKIEEIRSETIKTETVSSVSLIDESEVEDNKENREKYAEKEEKEKKKEDRLKVERHDERNGRVGNWRRGGKEQSSSQQHFGGVNVNKQRNSSNRRNGSRNGSGNNSRPASGIANSDGSWPRKPSHQRKASSTSNANGTSGTRGGYRGTHGRASRRVSRELA